MSRFIRSFMVAFIAILAMTATAGTASARNAYDGIWSVVVAAEAGACSGAYRYPVAIVNGYVRQAGPGFCGLFGETSALAKSDTCVPAIVHVLVSLVRNHSSG